MVPTIDSDNTLIERVRTGDEAAAEEIYQRYASRILGLVKSQMADGFMRQCPPEDIVQSVFKSIFRGVSQGAYEAPEGGTLWRLIAVVAIHKIRRNARQRNAAKRDARRTQEMERNSDLEPSSSDSPAEFERAIQEAIEFLNPSEQRVAMLRVQGFTVEEIGVESGRSRRSVERLLQSVRAKLASMLEVT